MSFDVYYSGFITFNKPGTASLDACRSDYFKYWNLLEGVVLKIASLGRDNPPVCFIAREADFREVTARYNCPLPPLSLFDFLKNGGKIFSQRHFCGQYRRDLSCR